MKHRMRTIMLILLTMLLLCPIQVLAADGENAVKTDLEDGEYSIQVELEGGSGKASVSSPTLMLVKEGKMYARLQWSSSNYDYMIVDGEKYLNESEEGRNSVFTVPVTALDDKMEVIADTLAMGAPHEIDYTLTFYEASIGSGGSEKSGCSCAGDHHRWRYPELFCKQKESVLNRFFFYALSHNIHNNEHV